MSAKGQGQKDQPSVRSVGFQECLLITIPYCTSVMHTPEDGRRMHDAEIIPRVNNDNIPCKIESLIR